MNKLSIAICVFLYSLCVGCVIVPTPEHTPKEINTRGEIDTKVFESKRVGSTSKEEVLLKLGEPDGVWKDERYFLYRWGTVRGYVGTYGSSRRGYVGAERHHWLIEFDEEDVIKQLGDFETWAAKVQGQKDRPLDPSTPVEIQVSCLHPPKPFKPVGDPMRHPKTFTHVEDARLIMGKDFFEIRGSSHDFRISPEKILLLIPVYMTGENWYEGVLTYEIHFIEKTAGGKKIYIQTDISSLTTLFEYLRQNCPNLVVQKFVY